MAEKTNIQGAWGWALLESSNNPDGAWWVDIATVRRTRREVIAYVLQNYIMSSDMGMTWAQAKRKYNWRVERVEVRPVLFGKEI